LRWKLADKLLGKNQLKRLSLDYPKIGRDITMFAVVNHLQFTKPVQEIKVAIEKDGLGFLAAHDGFINFHLVQETEDKAILVIFWKDAESASAGTDSFRAEWFAENLKPYLVWPEEKASGPVMISYKN
jgi:heme-degrading monooxygenase HmoA